MKIPKRKTRKPLWLVKQIRLCEFVTLSHQLKMTFSKVGVSAAELSQNLEKFNEVLRGRLEKKEEKYE